MAFFLLAGVELATPAVTWIKVKNPNYSQAVGRGEMFNRPISHL